MTTDTLRLRSATELLAVVPYLLGFAPSNSIMIICLHGSRIGLTVRLDLPPAGDGEAAVNSLMPSLLRERPDQVLLIAYEDQKGASAQAVDAMTAALEAAGIPVHDRLPVRDRRWRSLDCHDPSCCPPEGQAVAEPVDVPHVASEFVGQETAPYADRDALVDQLEPGSDCVSATDIRLAEALDAGLLWAVWPRILDAGDEAVKVTPGTAAAAAVSLQDVHLRDGLVTWLTPGTLDQGELPGQVQTLLAGMERSWDQGDVGSHGIVAMNRVQARLVHLCALLPDEHAAAALTVLAAFTWWRGNGTLTRAALDRALRCQPNYRLALLLQRMVDLAIRPRPNR